MLAWSFLALLLPTLYAKQRQLAAISPGGIETILASAIDRPGRVETALYTLAFFGRDLAETAAIVLAIGAAARFGYRPGPGRASRVTAGAILVVLLVLFSLVLGANLVAFRELGGFLQRDTLGIVLAWAQTSPGTARRYLGLETWLDLTMPAVWAALSLAFLGFLTVWTRRAPPPGSRMKSVRALVRHGVSPSWIGWAFAAGAASIGAASCFADLRPLPIWGFWSSAAAALAGFDRAIAGPSPMLSRDEIRKDYEALVYPLGRPAAAPRLLELPPARLRPRHIVLVGLETAPRKYYRILDAAGLPAFQRLRRHALVSDRHYSTRPTTTWSNYSILSGTYPARPRDVGRSLAWEGPGLPAILSRNGYRTAFVDSYRLDWHEASRYRRMLTALGIESLIDTSLDPDPRPATYEDALAIERRSFARALAALRSASAEGAKGFVFVSTLFGHYDWKSRPEDGALPAAEKIARNCRAIDGLLGEFLDEAERSGLGDDLLVVVTGDHGLRSASEFASLDEPMRVGEAAFGVPLVISARGLFEGETSIPWPTSHIDLAPTLLELVGLDPATTTARSGFARGGQPEGEDWLVHGESMLDGRLENRVLFLLNQGLTPADGYLWKDSFLSYNALTRIADMHGIDGSEGVVSSASRSAWSAAVERLPEALRDPERTIARARRLIDATALDHASTRRTPVEASGDSGRQGEVR